MSKPTPSLKRSWKVLTNCSIPCAVCNEMLIPNVEHECFYTIRGTGL